MCVASLPTAPEVTTQEAPQVLTRAKAVNPVPSFSARLSRTPFGWKTSNSPDTECLSREQAATVAIEAAVVAGARAAQKLAHAA